jgi:hypothetical protein
MNIKIQFKDVCFEIGLSPILLMIIVGILF